MGIEKAFEDAHKRKEKDEENEGEKSTKPAGAPDVWVEWVDDDFTKDGSYSCSRIHHLLNIYTPYYGRVLAIACTYSTSKPLADYESLTDVLVETADPYGADPFEMDQFSSQEIAFNNALAWALAWEFLIILNQDKEKRHWNSYDERPLLSLRKVIRPEPIARARRFVEQWNRKELQWQSAFVSIGGADGNPKTHS